MEQETISTGVPINTQLHLPPPIHLAYWNLKRLAILVGFLLTMLGTVGAYVNVALGRCRQPHA